MILFGAGSSVPFDIPGMMGFTTQFKHFIEDSESRFSFIQDIEDAISKTEEIIGISISFDLETLLSLLTDLSGVISEKPISIPTASFLLKNGLNIKSAREKHKENAFDILNKLRDFIFKVCMKPIKNGRDSGNFKFLDRFYGPLMTVLNKTDLRNIQEPIRKIYSTNWDICFKTWADYVNIPINDGTDIDRQSLPILSVQKFERTITEFNYVPLHGSLDLIKIERQKRDGTYKDIFKISDPIRYFEEKPDNIKDVFIIYPLEAIGYEESIRSPYLDMLYNFRKSLESETIVFIIGYSLRDPTIGSIFEEVIAMRIRGGDITPLSSDIEFRKTQAHEHRLKIIIINPNPNKLVNNLKKQLHSNLLSTFVPIKVEFPKITDEDFNEKYSQVLSKLIDDLIQIGHLPKDAKPLQTVLENRFSLSV